MTSLGLRPESTPERFIRVIDVVHQQNHRMQESLAQVAIAKHDKSRRHLLEIKSLDKIPHVDGDGKNTADF